jgi:hypothetical protein
VDVSPAPSDAAPAPITVTPTMGMLTAVPVEVRELPVLEVPRVALEHPSTKLEPTPSPVPRVSLIPASALDPTVSLNAVPSDAASLDTAWFETGSFDTETLDTEVLDTVVVTPGDASEASALVGRSLPNSRSLPTLAARQALPRRPAAPRQVAPAVTFPPGSGSLRGEAKISRLAADVRSSKREIVLGLAIGMALAAAFGLLGQRYLAQRELGADPGPTLAATVSEPRVGEPPARELSATVHDEWALRPESKVSSTAAPPLQPQEAMLVADDESAPISTEQPPRERRPRSSKRPKRAVSAHPAADPASANPVALDPFTTEPRARDGELVGDSEPEPKAPPSPAESAGLGLDLTL